MVWQLSVPLVRTADTWAASEPPGSIARTFEKDRTITEDGRLILGTAAAETPFLRFWASFSLIDGTFFLRSDWNEGLP